MTSQPNRLGSEGVDIRLLIADSEPRVRHSLEALLTALGWSSPRRAGFTIEIVGEANDGAQVITQIQSLQPQVIVLDLPIDASASAMTSHTVKFPDVTSPMDGLATILAIKARWPAIRIVVLTMHATARVAVLEAGADAFLLKGCPTNELLDAICFDTELGKGTQNAG